MDIVYYFGSRKQAEMVAKILPRIFQGTEAGRPWRFEVQEGNRKSGFPLCILDPVEGSLHSAERRAQIREQAHGWCRGYLYAKTYGGKKAK